LFVLERAGARVQAFELPAERVAAGFIPSGGR